MVGRSVWSFLSFGASEYWGQIWGNQGVPTAASPALLRDERQPPGLRGVVPQYQGCGTACPSGSICTTVAGSAACVADGRFVLVTETLSTGMDGLTPGLLESFNEYPTMLRQFCVDVRLERGFAPSPWNAEPGDPCSNAAVF